MKKHWLVLGLAFLFALASRGVSNAQVNVGFEVGNNGLDAFHIAIGDYFKVSPQQVQTCQESNIPDEDQPVVFFIAQRANVSPEAVVLLRSRGWNWMQIAKHFRLNPRIFYTPGSYNGTPYENGHRAFHGNNARINLSDADIVNFVNLKMASEHYGHDPQEIARLRAQGKSFREIHDNFSQRKEAVEWDAKEEPRRNNRPNNQQNQWNQQGNHQDQQNNRDHQDQRDNRDKKDRDQRDNRDKDHQDGDNH